MTNEPDEFPLEFLAGYVDGELRACDLARVERWLADHPESRELLETQESLSPANADLYFALTPPQPSCRQWAERYGEIASRLQLSRPGRRWAALGVAAAVLATAVAVLILISPVTPTAPPLAQPATTELAAAAEAPYPMADDDDVRIVSLPEAAASLLVVGEHPLADSILILAMADEVEFFGVGSNLAGRFPERPGDPAIEEPPVLWAPRDP